jgi:hypothetical protein
LEKYFSMTAVYLLLLLLLLKMKNTPKSELYSLKDLFEIQTGIVEDNYSLSGTEKKKEIEFLKINSFTKDGELIPNLKTKSPKRKFSKQDPEIKEIKEDKIIQEYDILIYTRGVPRGFFAKRFLNVTEKKFVATHHFIYLRPLLHTTKFNMSYLNLMIELFIQNNLVDHYEKKLDQNKSTQNLGNSITIKELKDLKIKLLSDSALQESVVVEYQLRKDKVMKAKSDLQSLDDQIYKSEFDLDTLSDAQ